MEQPQTWFNYLQTILERSKIYSRILCKRIALKKLETNSGKQPESFQGNMTEYQIEGYEWLLTLYDMGMSGILADEMGLGKTIQAIALILRLVERNTNGPFLVVAPLSAHSKWLCEFKRFAPSVRTILFHGRKRDSRYEMREIRESHVVITHYNCVINDKRLLSRAPWMLIIVCEGPCTLNDPDRVFIEALKTYKSETRLLFSGTPLPNNVFDLVSILELLLSNTFDDLHVFESLLDAAAATVQLGDGAILARREREHRLMISITTLQQLLTQFLLRRTKADTNINLPAPKRELIVHARMSALQEKHYQLTLDNSIKKLLGIDVNLQELEIERPCHSEVDYKTFCTIDDFHVEKKFERMFIETIENDKRNENREVVSGPINLNIGSLMMRLKKIVTHPFLIEYPLTVDEQYLLSENIVNRSGKLRVVDCLLKELKKRGHKVLIFSQMTTLLDILHDYCVMREYKFCRLDGIMSLKDRAENISQFENDPEKFVFLISTRAGEFDINLSSADTEIIIDSDWTPQRQDRCHCFGQTKPVIVYRIVTSNSIDERILIRANDKPNHENVNRMKRRLRGKKITNDQIVEYLGELLKSMPKRQSELPEQEQIFTEEQLEILMDRSFSGDRNC